MPPQATENHAQAKPAGVRRAFAEGETYNECARMAHLFSKLRSAGAQSESPRLHAQELSTRASSPHSNSTGVTFYVQDQVLYDASETFKFIRAFRS